MATGLSDGASRDGIHLHVKKCPACGAQAQVFALKCPVCGFAWYPDASDRRGRDPARRIWIALAVAVAGLLLSLCLLYVVVLSFRR